MTIISYITLVVVSLVLGSNFLSLAVGAACRVAVWVSLATSSSTVLDRSSRCTQCAKLRGESQPRPFKIEFGKIKF